ncbi:MAG: hypothetical protein CMO01_27140 [Thalassobius sp.]|nr:hypothetical protein [Thalassovita sp.]
MTHFKTLLLLCISLIVCTGCSSKDVDPKIDNQDEYFFKFKVDSNLVEYEYKSETQINLTGLLGYDVNSGQYTLNIAGIDNIFETTFTNRLTIFIGNSSELSTGVTYSNISEQGDETPDFIFLVGYYDIEGNLYSAGLNTIAELYKTTFVKLSQITETQISGTFSGTLLQYDTNGGTLKLLDSVVISEGEFNVPIMN